MSLAPSHIRSNGSIEGDVQYEGVKLHGALSNHGLLVPGRSHAVQIQISNPMRVAIKSIRVTLKQYRTIVDEESDFTVISTLLTGPKSKGFNSEYHQSTYELFVPLEKCQLMAPTSSQHNVRYELHIHCHVHGLFKSHFTLALPALCSTDHQRTLKILDELKALPEILEHLSIDDEEPVPPSYADFVESEVLPRYEDVT